MQLVVVLLIALCAAAQGRPDAHVGAHEIIPGMGEYYFGETPVNWSSAFRQCQASGGHLTVINSVAEKEALQEMMVTHGAGSVLVGFHDQFLEGVYTFITGRSVADNTASDSLWAPTYPLGNDTNNCGFLNAEGIYDGPCTKLSPFICELSKDQSGQENLNGFTLLEGFGYYKAHNESVTWPEAWTTCREEGSDLVVLHTEAELNALHDAFQPYMAFFWVGVHRRWGPDEGFVTVRNVALSELEYQTWNSASQPIGSYETNPFLMSYSNEGLGTQEASYLAIFICERPL